MQCLGSKLLSMHGTKERLPGMTEHFKHGLATPKPVKRKAKVKATASKALTTRKPGPLRLLPKLHATASKEDSSDDNLDDVELVEV